ncbi:MAG: WD40 repeat domain-containing protein, partial [Verrucomicrobiae bacterium]|nr:WD40 repeat domain-containing protein [Verrucomicrobiae bacterium]
AATLCQRPDVIFSIVPDPVGRWVAVGEALGGLTLWDPIRGQKTYETTEPINRFSQNPSPEGNRVRTRVAAIPGSTLLAYCASLDGTNPVVNLWNPATRRIEKSLPQPYLVRDLAVTPDGRRLLVTLFDPAKAALLWDLESGTELARYPIAFPDFSVGNPLALSPDGRFATFDQPGALVVFDLQTGRERWRFPTLDLYVGAAAFSPDGKWLALGNGYSNPTIQLWDLADGTEAARFEGHQGWVRDLLFTPDGTRLISASADQSVLVWDVATRRAVRALRGHDSEVSALALSPDGKTLSSGAKSGEVLSFRVDPLPPEKRVATRIRIPAAYWHFLPGGADLLVTTTNRTLVRVRAPAFDQPEPFGNAGTNCIGAQGFVQQPRYVVFHGNGDATLHTMVDHSLQATWHLADEPFIGVGILPQTENLISITADLRGQVTDPNTGQVLSRWRLTDWGRTQHLSADGKSVWVLHYDGSVLVTDLYTGQTHKRRFDHGNTVAVAFSTDHPDLLATCSDTGFVRLVSASTLQTRQLLGRYRLSVWSACFAPEERLASVGNADEDLKLWDLRTGRELLTLTSDQTHGNPVSVSPDGSTFVQRGIPEHDLFVWRAPSWEELGETDR